MYSVKEEKKKIKLNNTFGGIIIILMTMISGIAINIDPARVGKYKGDTGVMTELIKRYAVQLGEVGLADMVAVILVMMIFYHVFMRRKIAFSLTAFWVSFVLSCFYVIGISYSSYYDSRFILGDGLQVVVSLTTLFGVMLVLYAILTLVYDMLDRRKYILPGKTSYIGWHDKIDRHFFLFCFITLIVVWLLFMIPFLPGSIPFDGRKQLNQYYGYMTMTTHHPYYSTMLIGLIYDIGKWMFGAVGGVLLFVFLQTVVGALVFAKICCFIKECTRGMRAGFFSLLFFAINPLFWTNMQAVQKDTIGFISFALFMLEFVRIFMDKNVSKKNYRWLGIAGLIHCLFRHEGKYLVLIAFVILFVIMEKRRKLVATVITIGIIFALLNSVVVDGLKIQPGNRIESYSIVVQQVARYVKMYRKEMTYEEKLTIDSVLEYRDLSTKYNPEVADPVKNNYKQNYSIADWKAFVRQWMLLFKKHPEVYVDAAIDEMFGYVYPFYFYRGMAYYQLYTKEPIGDFDKDVEYSHYFMSENIRESCKRGIYLWDKIPFLSMLINCGVYTWLGIIMLGALIRKKDWKSAIIFIIPAFSIGICFLSPVNGYIRYMMREVAVMPLYILITWMCYAKASQHPEDIVEMAAEGAEGITAEASGEAAYEDGDDDDEDEELQNDKAAKSSTAVRSGGTSQRTKKKNKNKRNSKKRK